MGYYEGWDGVWRSDMQIGWVCPRCERFVSKYDEHSCEATQAELGIQELETQHEKTSQHRKPR